MIPHTPKTPAPPTIRFWNLRNILIDQNVKAWFGRRPREVAALDPYEIRMTVATAVDYMIGAPSDDKCDAIRREVEATILRRPDMALA